MKSCFINFPYFIFNLLKMITSIVSIRNFLNSNKMIYYQLRIENKVGKKLP